MNINGSL
jgi:hypothetical protein